MCKFLKVYGVRFNEAQALHQQQLTAELQPRNLVRRSGLQRITKRFSTTKGLACIFIFLGGARGAILSGFGGFFSSWISEL